jgi:hypothetical protein
VVEAARQQGSSGETQREVLQGPIAVKDHETEKPADTAAVSSTVPDPPAASLAPPPASTKLPVSKSTPANALSATAAAYKGRIEQVAAEKHLRLSIRGSGSTLTLSGKLRPADHGDLLRFLRSAPSGVQVVDDIQYDDTTPGRPNPSTGTVASVRIVTNIAGAIASLSSGSSPARQCETPCSFSGLDPGDYSLQVKKSGFQPVQTALQVLSGDSLDQKIQLEPLSQGLFIASQPAGADVFINGDKQSGQTPLTIPLAPGKYNLVLRLSGYDAYVNQIEVRADGQSKVNAELRQKNGRVAWAQISSFPEGAEIWLDGSDTGQRAPARVEVPSGIHNIVLKLDGYQSARQVIQASEGGTIPVSKILTKTR